VSGGLFTGLFVEAMKLTEEPEAVEEKEKEESTQVPDEKPAEVEP
jgi:hypothetical protein